MVDSGVYIWTDRAVIGRGLVTADSVGPSKPHAGERAVTRMPKPGPERPLGPRGLPAGQHHPRRSCSPHPAPRGLPGRSCPLAAGRAHPGFVGPGAADSGRPTLKKEDEVIGLKVGECRLRVRKAIATDDTFLQAGKYENIA